MNRFNRVKELIKVNIFSFGCRMKRLFISSRIYYSNTDNDFTKKYALYVALHLMEFHQKT
jgi:hypothetical protein